MAENRIITDERLDSIAIIMDGNGRWAKLHGKERSSGHIAGAKIIEDVLSHFHDINVHNVTIYAFSTENWKRSKHEVDMLMELFYHYLDKVLMGKIKAYEDFSIKFIGDLSAFPEKFREKCTEAERASDGRPFICNVALNYGGRAEIVHAANAALADGNTTLTEEILARYMYSAHSPDPDLVIRTGGNFRISNFLLWQSAYSEYIILDTLWPDFTAEDIDRCVEEFYKRNRRFGGHDTEDKI